MAYSPQYISRGEVPVQIPDDYSDQEKLDAIEFAEASAELDLKDGESFESKELTPTVVTAIKQKTTCELAKSAEHPDDVRLTDLNEGEQESYASDAFCDRYDELISKLMKTEIFADDGGSDGAYVYNTHEGY